MDLEITGDENNASFSMISFVSPPHPALASSHVSPRVLDGIAAVSIHGATFPDNTFPDKKSANIRNFPQFDKPTPNRPRTDPKSTPN